MAKYHGKVGFVVVDEIRPGVWKEIVTEREYSIELKTMYNRFVSGDTTALYDDSAF